jgi:hypothetical protein
LNLFSYMWVLHIQFFFFFFFFFFFLKKKKLLELYKNYIEVVDVSYLLKIAILKKNDICRFLLGFYLFKCDMIFKITVGFWKGHY